ncbi:30S ribosomal protein S8 [Anaplasma marginale str. Dawn]|uniref:Small ribosomal subunit protein uS8 n=3 Tax=Anaplasma marginale TaxID=770 RepID=RS8_ANAMF|nr:30S ribosomal protein S8 [Anaplasma marginale]B9KJ56.1 RecName: Full=Small ribosomal subunit protein uS8; AltName: Full=30S ribosomal protein S8 [Anaplasma marginale str. Florida]Q5PA72.1 RecName: Full=Small ribosomal subunit protein uS8; AltName: Full=30S ribosomal protein S8 [Anaplasma marginale str. St. Maries]AAV86808.1 30S ribosomal protein S8 [Anaplasma marginale str. St. Maries]ACM49518.1 30S ribosomal protein S8 (rpsH) [Anaplasma marginale str. Florida]AGZ79013.1 30S ribosomal prote
MSLSDPIADFLTRLRNGQAGMNKVVFVPHSKVVRSILDILLAEGYIEGFTEESKSSGIKYLKVCLKYYNCAPVIKKIVRVSRPGKRVYSSADRLPKFYNGLGVYIVSTSQGVMLDYRARKLGIGGEILCGVF